MKVLGIMMFINWFIQFCCFLGCECNCENTHTMLFINLLIDTAIIVYVFGFNCVSVYVLV